MTFIPRERPGQTQMPLTTNQIILTWSSTKSSNAVSSKD
jgi:hypothetical protein